MRLSSSEICLFAAKYYKIMLEFKNIKKFHLCFRLVVAGEGTIRLMMSMTNLTYVTVSRDVLMCYGFFLHTAQPKSSVAVMDLHCVVCLCLSCGALIGSVLAKTFKSCCM